ALVRPITKTFKFTFILLALISIVACQGQRQSTPTSDTNPTHTGGVSKSGRSYTVFSPQKDKNKEQEKNETNEQIDTQNNTDDFVQEFLKTHFIQVKKQEKIISVVL